MEHGWRVASFNIRMKTHEPDPNDNWELRRDALVQELVNSQAAIIGLQELGSRWEVKPEQLAFLTSVLGEHGFSSVGFGRGANGDDEASPIFFKSAETLGDAKTFHLVREGQRWLSTCPGTPGSRLEGAGCPRVVTQALLKCKQTGKELQAWCADREVVAQRHKGSIAAVRARGAALQFALFEFRIDHDVVLEAVKQDSSWLCKVAGSQASISKHRGRAAMRPSKRPANPTLLESTPRQPEPPKSQVPESQAEESRALGGFLR
eukprot:Skav235255  [mRNA]  locus=scaffold3995:377463:393480:+ [translate_table: standard]